MKRFELSERAGTIRVFRVTVPEGTHADLTAAIPGMASVSISIPEACRRVRGFDVCTQPEEACPMPAATWRFRLRKLAGPAGEIKVEFLVGSASRP